MPTYDYLCPNGHRFEVIHSVTAAGPETCPVCGAAPVRKAVTAPTIHFKGSGWAKKDRRATPTTGTTATTDASSGETAAAASTKDKDKEKAKAKDAGSKGDASPSDSASAAPGPAAPASPSSAAD
jgi:putative FmdB family regulatory protein